MDYETMSDFEINAAVTSFIYGCESWALNNAEFYHCGIDGSGYFSQPVIDYCNKPESAWPIILGSKITIEPIECFGELWQANLKRHKFMCANPLRAAMIAFLKANNK